jgi:hypothetical protein
LIQAQRDLVELRLRMDGQVGSSREVLPQQEIRVFVGAALPGTLWISESTPSLAQIENSGDQSSPPSDLLRRRPWLAWANGHTRSSVCTVNYRR